MNITEGRYWFEFGIYEDGLYVDIADSEDSTLFAHVPNVLAQEIIEKHNKSLEAIDERYNRVARKGPVALP